MLLLVAFGVFVLHVPWGQSLSGLVALLFSFGLASVAFGTLLGTFVRSTGQANGLSIILGMTMGLLGGCMMPLEFFPPAVRTAVHVLPVTWAMEGMTDLTMRGQGLAGVLPEAAALLGFAIVFFILGVRRFRYE
jgi:ABC-2 type transport system permease protein